MPRRIIFSRRIAIVALEFSGDLWARYRRAVVGTLVFVFNAAIIVGLTGACIAAAMAGPVLAQR